MCEGGTMTLTPRSPLPVTGKTGLEGQSGISLGPVEYEVSLDIHRTLQRQVEI